ncbi:cytochrome P450 [Earliella scabrosa]|nr:cytochrome P450 [Earliella scabrosa]
MAAIITAAPLVLTAGVAALSAVLLFIAYPDRYVTTNPRPDLPGPKGLPVLGNLLQVIPWRYHVLQWFIRLIEAYGPICTFTFPPWGRGILINRPEWLAHIKKADMQKYSRGPIAVEVFSEFPGGMAPVASEGAQWRLARKTMFPIFTIRAFTEHVSLAMNELVPMTRKLLLSASNQGVPIDWNDLAGRIAIAIFTRSSFNTKTDILQPDVECMKRPDTLRDALQLLNLMSARRLFNPFWRVTEIITGDRFRFIKARRYIRDIVSDMVRQRKETESHAKGGASDHHDDFLSMLLKDPTFDDPVLIRDILVTVLFAGRDNTQNALAWGLHALMKEPKWIDRLREEAKVNRKPDREMDYQELASYPVHLAVFYETVRLWPGLPKNARLALCDDVLPALPQYDLPAVKVEKGEYIFWSDYHMMRSAEVWGPTANDFDPGRHLNADGSFVRPTQPNFNAFGAGPRLCPAAQLATYEFVACLAGILPYFDFTHLEGVSPNGKPCEAPSMAETYTSSLAAPLWVTVRRCEGAEVPQ